MAGSTLPSPDYPSWLVSIKARIQSARISAARAANRELILLYWDIGRQRLACWKLQILNSLFKISRIAICPIQEPAWLSNQILNSLFKIWSRRCPGAIMWRFSRR